MRSTQAYRFRATPTGTRYHKPDCPRLAAAQDEGTVRSLRAKDVLALGFQPCQDCRPSLPLTVAPDPPERVICTCEWPGDDPCPRHSL